MNKCLFYNVRCVFSMCLLLSGCIFVNYSFGDDYYNIKVAIIDIRRANSMEEMLSPVRNAKTDEEAKGLLDKLLSLYKKPDLSGVEIVLTGFNLPQKIVKCTDKAGEVVFERIPRGNNEILAQKDVIENGKSVKAVARARLKSGKRIAFMQLSTDWVSLKGRVLNADGTPVAGTLIYLEPLFTGQDSPEQYNDYPQQKAVSGVDGSYELPYVKPLSVDLATGYLINSYGVERSQKFFYGEIYAKKNTTAAYVPPKLRIPLISEDILKQARSRISQTRKMALRNNQEKGSACLPESKGNVIFLPDIIIDDDKTKPTRAETPKTRQ